MKNLLTHFSKIRGYFSASQGNDIGYDCRLTVGSPSFHRRSTMLKLVSVLAFLLTIGVGNTWAGTDFKTETFENQTDETTYNDTRSYATNVSNAGIAWFVEHGCVSKTDKLDDTKSMHMRAYYAKKSSSTTWNGNLPYLESQTDVKGLVSITFDAAVSNTYLHMDVMYSTNSGSTWNYMYKTNASSGTNASNITFSGTTKTSGTYYIPSAALSPTGDYRIKIAINSGSTHSNNPGSKGSYTFRVDDVKFTYTAYSVTYDGNGKTSGSVPTDATKYLSGATVTVKSNSGSLAKTGYTFGGWNTQDDGLGTNYTAGTGTFSISSDITLYAKWNADASCDAPSAPTNSSVSGTGVTISTSSSSANYDIYYSTSSTTPTTEDPTATISSGNSKAITGLSYGTTYYYWMRQNCGGGSTSSWVAGSPTSFTTTVPAPTGVSAGSLSMTGATISITDANDVNNYDVYCSTSSSAPDGSTTPSASGTSKSIAVTGLTSGETYYYWARAKGPNAKSAWVGGSTFTTLTLSSISVSTAPTKTKYLVGDNFDPTALVITRTYSNSTSDTYSYAGHTSEFSFSPATNAALTALNTSVTITYGGQTASQAINVYTVTVNKVNMSGTAITADGVTASCSGRTLSQSVGSTNYKFEEYAVTAGGVSVSTNTITGTPTGNVTINAKFHDPITVTKGTGTGTSTFTVSPTGEVKHGSSVTVTCAATDGYKNPWTLTVTPSDGATYDETGSTGSITISNITKNITVDLAYTDKGCTTHNGTNVVSGSTASNKYGPISTYYNYSTRQILYTRTDLNLAAGKKGIIKSIYFDAATATTNKNITIYMANTTLETLSTSNYVSYGDFTQVYTSSTWACSTGWNEIELTTPFEYNGVGNLVVLIDDNTGSYVLAQTFNCHTESTTVQIWKGNDSNNEDPETTSWSTYEAITTRPNTKFCIQEADMVEATVNWYVNGEIVATETDYEGTALSSEPTPDSEDCDGSKVFVGWYDNTYSHATDAPDFVTPKVIPEGGANYYAVFAQGAFNTYEKCAASSLEAGKVVLIVNHNSSVALSSDKTVNVFDAISVSPSDNKITTTNSKIMWTLESGSSGYYLKQSSSYLNAGESKQGNVLLWFDGDTDDWQISGSNPYVLTSSNQSDNSIQYDGSAFTTGTGTSGNAYEMDFYIETPPTNFATTCCTQHTISLASSGSVPGGTFNSGGVAKACATREITLTATPSNSGYVFNGWTVEDGSSNDVTTTVLGSGHESDNPATMTMPDYNVTVTAAFSAISSISVKTAPTKTVYLEGETFDPTGLVITATYANSATVDVPYSGNEALFTLSPTTATALTTENASVSITYNGQTTSQSITVYSVTLQALDENGDAIRVGGPAAPTRDGATVTKAANVDNYVYKEWVVSGATLADGANANQKIITDPTGAVTVTVKYYLPRVVKWMVNGEEWKPYTDTGSGTDGTAEVARGAQWKTLTLPTDPNPLNDEGCGDKFIGWTNAEISGQLDKDDDAAAISTLVDSNLLNSANKSGKTKTINANPYIFYAVFADYVE